MLEKNIESMKEMLESALKDKTVINIPIVLDLIKKVERDIENSTAAKMHKWMADRVEKIQEDYETMKRNDWTVAFNSGQFSIAVDFWQDFALPEDLPEPPPAEEMIKWIEDRLDMEKQCLHSYTGDSPGEMYSAVKVLCEKFLERFTPQEDNRTTKAKKTLQKYIGQFSKTNFLVAKEFKEVLDTLNELTEDLDPTRKGKDEECWAPKRKRHYDPWKNEAERKKELGIYKHSPIAKHPCD